METLKKETPEAMFLLLEPSFYQIITFIAFLLQISGVILLLPHSVRPSLQP